MTKIHALIFSKDRALQLDATLRSLIMQVDNLLESITVLYKTSTSRYSIQYDKLKKEYPQVDFVKENRFRQDLIEVLCKKIPDPQKRLWFIFLAKINGHRFLGRYSIVEVVVRFLMRLGIKLGRLPLESCCPDQYWLLSVDDNIFIKPFNLEEIAAILVENHEAIGFSLRLGENINYCYMRDVPQKQPKFDKIEEDSKVLHYNWADAEHDFGYPLEISSSIYRASLITPLIACLYFSTPNMLESKMASMRKWYMNRYPLLTCYSSSVSFCIPLNKVQQDRPFNRSNYEPHYSIEGLAKLFDEGKRIDLVSLEHLVPNACHQEVKLKFTESRV